MTDNPVMTFSEPINRYTPKLSIDVDFLPWSNPVHFLYYNALDTLHRLWHFLHMATITLHNIDPALKTEAMTIMKRHGLTASDAVSAFLRKIVNDHESGLSCFCCDLDPNKETAQDLEDARAGRVKYITSQDTDDLFKKLGI